MKREVPPFPGPLPGPLHPVVPVDDNPVMIAKSKPDALQKGRPDYKNGATCPDCHGDGRAYVNGSRISGYCTRCGGSGSLPEHHMDHTEERPMQEGAVMTGLPGSTTVGCLTVVMGLTGLSSVALGTLGIWLRSGNMLREDSWESFLIPLAVGLATLVSAWFFFKRRAWAYWVGLFWAVIMIFGGMGFGLLLTYHLTKRRTRETFFKGGRR